MPASGYHFVLFHWAIITVTRRSLRLAVSLASLTFTALQVLAAQAADCLCWICSPRPERTCHDLPQCHTHIARCIPGKF